ncbi:MAG: copper chaperone PCu(A)C [Candidatus Omnitrophica bacterium]|nr:copper chaperone PCu(A)C [Candidatus Omnitrophota bacterium]
MKFNKIILSVLIFAIGFCKCALAEDLPDAVVVSGAWIKAMPASAEYSAAFLTMTNNSENDITLNEVKTNLSKTVVIHEMKMENGAMKMRKINNLVIPKGEAVNLESGGTHIMLIDLIKPLVEGEKADLILVFSDGKEQTVSAIIQKEVYSDEE